MASGGGGRRGRRQKPRAKGKGRAKKTKYLSLSDLIKAEVDATPAPTPGDEPASPRAPWEEAEVKTKEEGGDGGDGPPLPPQQVEPFALHHEASTLFEALPAPSLSEILGPSPSASPDGGSGASGLPGAEEEDLARRALRGRERWVYCSGGSASSPTATATTTTTTTSSSSPCSSAASTGASARSLRLKLDYEEILAAWADRGSLYIGAGGGKPGLELDAVCHARSPQRLLVRAGLGDAAVSVTPAPPSSAQEVLVGVEVEPSEHAVAATCAPETAPGRAERVMRYKEKRRRRLFAKRIRYEVRRVNAVRRPRFKGRFIKEHEECELQPI